MGDGGLDWWGMAAWTGGDGDLDWWGRAAWTGGGWQPGLMG